MPKDKEFDKEFLNYWNLRQVIFLEGQMDLTFDLNSLQDIIQRLEIIPKIETDNLGGVNVLYQEIDNEKYEEISD